MAGSRSLGRIITSALLLLVLLGVGLSLVYSEENQLDERLAEAYLAVREVSESHGEVGPLVDLLNQAIDELESGGDPESVASHLDAVDALTAEERTRSVAEGNSMYLVAGAQVAFTGALVYAAWRYLPRVFWRRWLMVKRGWLVEYADR